MGKRKKEKKLNRQLKPDDYFNNGIIEMARYGKINSMRSLRSEEGQHGILNTWAEMYESKKKELDNLVAEIIENVRSCDPLELLQFSQQMFLMTMIGKMSEIEYDMSEIAIGRMTEYVQSILVSSENSFTENIKDYKDPSIKYSEIKKKIEDLHSKIQFFYGYWGAWQRRIRPEFDDVNSFIIEAQTMYMVRGKRYQKFEFEYLEKLLVVHDEILKDIFAVNTKDIIFGLQKLQYSLVQARIDAIGKLGDQIDIITLEEKDNSNKEQVEELQLLLEECFGFALNDVRRVTGWSQKFVNSLAYGINENKVFLSDIELSGWPIIDLPIQKKPFIRIEDEVYCFDYYSLFDNFYRVIQKTIKEYDPYYVDTWSKKQQYSSEKIVEDLFKKLLPGCSTYRDNYYSINTSKKNYAENDIIVVYEDVLIIIEVKAGSFVFTPPITDYEAHIKSFRTLVEKADHQCDRTLKYLQDNENAPILDSDKNQKVNINLKEFSGFYTFAVTVDNFNEFAAKAEKLSFLELKSNSISISIDDLFCYSEYFNSTLEFLHFIEQRKEATKNPNISLNDELDHLGMYIEHNLYSKHADRVAKDRKVIWYGYREKLDKYFMSLSHPFLSIEKPIRNIPQRVGEIINFLDNNQVRNKVLISSYLLDFSTDSKKEFSETIDKVLNRQLELEQMLVQSMFGERRITTFVRQPNINIFDESFMIKYVQVVILKEDEDDRVMLLLDYNKENHLVGVDYKICYKSEIQDSEIVKLREIGERIPEIKKVVIETKGNKIGRNDTCPCGSDIKYKKCCGS
jgi:hypothetical protein